MPSAYQAAAIKACDRVRVILFFSERIDRLTTKGKNSIFFVAYFNCLIFSLVCIPSALPSLLPLAINALLTQCQCPRHGPFRGRGVVRDSGPPGRKNLHVTFDKASYHFFEISSEGKKSVECCSRDIYGLMTQS